MTGKQGVVYYKRSSSAGSDVCEETKEKGMRSGTSMNNRKQ